MLYVYGIVDAPQVGIDVRGHADAAVHAVACGDFAAAVSPLDGDAAPQPDNVWRHERVLQALMRAHAVLPSRFGTLVRDDAMLHAQLQRQQSAFVNELARLRGKVEFALRATVNSAAPAESTTVIHEAAPCATGAGYLRAKAARLREQTAYEDAARVVEHLLRRQFDIYACNAAWDVVPDASARLIASYLVERDKIAAFRATVDRARERHPALDITCTGPWAPYSFVALGGVEARS